MRVLRLDPAETLHFVQTPALPNPIKILRIANTSSTVVAFKVKTTAPKAYLVRPNFGTLEPNQEMEIQIVFQLTGDAVREANSHRFLVQAIGLAESSPVQVTRENWAEFDKALIQEARLSVTLQQQSPAEPEQAAQAQARGGETQSANLQHEYDNLVPYTLKLEKEKKRLEEEKKRLEAKVLASSGGDGFSRMTLILAVLIAFFASYMAQSMAK